MWLIVGLGNPGAEYQHNRHNIGFMAADEIIRRHNLSERGKKFQGLLADGMIAGEKVIVLKPQTYMNLSGQSVQAAAAFYKIPMDRIIVFHDEMDLAAGKIRTKFAGGAAGHNGLRSIDAHLGQDYWRVRLGIGRPDSKERVTGHVLGNFAKADQEWLEKLLVSVGDHAERLVKDDMDGFMSKVAHDMMPPKPVKEEKENENGV